MPRQPVKTRVNVPQNQGTICLASVGRFYKSTLRRQFVIDNTHSALHAITMNQYNDNRWGVPCLICRDNELEISAVTTR